MNWILSKTSYEIYAQTLLVLESKISSNSHAREHADGARRDRLLQLIGAVVESSIPLEEEQSAIADWRQNLQNLTAAHISISRYAHSDFCARGQRLILMRRESTPNMTAVEGFLIRNEPRRHMAEALYAELEALLSAGALAMHRVELRLNEIRGLEQDYSSRSTHELVDIYDRVSDVCRKLQTNLSKAEELTRLVAMSQRCWRI